MDCVRYSSTIHCVHLVDVVVVAAADMSSGSAFDRAEMIGLD